MVIGLVNELGRESADGRKVFPTADAMAKSPKRFFANRSAPAIVPHTWLSWRNG